MDMFAPEQRERTELYRVKREFSPLMEKQIHDRLAQGQETFPDIITCPNRSCRNPLVVTNEKEFLNLTCGNCGWSKRIYKQKKDGG
jgi:hypothetical protein